MSQQKKSGRDEEFKLLFTDIDFLPPVTPPNNVIAFGRNYEDHASELNHEVDSLYVFTKAASSLTGDEATILIIKILQNNWTMKANLEL